MKKKSLILSFILIIGFIFLLGGNVFASSTIQAGKADTNGSNLNIRASSSVSSGILGKISDNSYFSIISSNGSWYYVEYKENKFGYVHKDYVEIVSTNAKKVDTQGANLNARTGPSTSYLVFDKIADNDYVVVLSTANGWSRVLFEGNKIGYVSSSYLSGASQKYPQISLNVQSYKQFDSRWANETIGSSGQTFKQIGCLTTGMAMVESYRRGATITPLYMETLLSYTSSGSMYWPSRYSFYSSSGYLSQIYSLLKSGKPVLVGLKKASGSQHWVVVYGYKGSDTLSLSNFLIRDPGSSYRSTLQEVMNTYPTFYKLAYYNY
ncbi:MAG: hypothetical protein E7176_03640 [Erysipelotrichaceae bacterium]|nr:hypothetical protein [Erysipelotrichaceae bacterium]